jgi:hypothetical protein
MNELEKEIAELTAKHELQQRMDKALPDSEIWAHTQNHSQLGTKFTVHVDLMETPLHQIKAEIERVLQAFSTDKNHILTHPKHEGTETVSPFCLMFQNKGKHGNTCAITYVSGENWMHIALPIDYYSNDVKEPFQRKIYDTEYGSYEGHSYSELSKMTTIAYRLGMFKSISWYGGDVTHHIINPDEKVEYESVVLTGHIPQFTEGWQESLKE